MDYRSRWQQKRRDRATRRRLILIVVVLAVSVVAIVWLRGIARPAPAGYQIARPCVCWLSATDESVLVTTRTGELLKLTPELNEVATGWTSPFAHPAGFWGRAALADRSVVVGCEDVRVRAVDLATGVQAWEVEVGGAVPAVTADGEHVYFASAEPALYAVTADGTVVWRTPLGTEVASAPLVTEETVVVGTLGGSVCAYERASGVELWAVKPEEAASIYASPRMGPSSILVGDDNGLLHSVARTGELLSTMEFEGLVRQPVAVRDAVVVAGDSSGLLRRIDPSDMTEMWSTHLPGALAAEPLISEEAVWCGAGRSLVAVDAEDGSVIARHVAEAQTSDVIAAHGRIYWATTDGRIGAVPIQP